MPHTYFASLPVRDTGEVSQPVQRLCRGITRLIGWRVSQWNVSDDVKRVVVIGEHHTANLDSYLMIIIVAAMGRRLSWLVKKELDLPVIGWMIRRTGGIFVNRHHPNGTVGHVVEIINESEQMFLALAPSSTRAKTDRWRTGFYHMANGANVPVALGFLDYATKSAGIGKTIMLSGNMEADAEIFREFYAGITARHPEKASDVRLISPPELPNERKAG
jgi:1-acyl-sn-glycerol-3-phosphate acyltransferase